MISIGAIYCGPELENSAIQRAVMATSRIVNELRGPLELGKTPLVNAVFVVEGSLGNTDSSHLIYGKHAKKDKMVVVQIPVPSAIAHRENLEEFMIESLRGANAMAFEFFRNRGEEFPLREAEALVSAVQRRLSN